MYSKVESSMLRGIKTMKVYVEVDISNGMPMIDMVGYLSSEVKEAKERVKTALHNCKVVLPPKRITINLSPANIKKSSTSFDLPIAVALLVSLGFLDKEKIERHIFVGELSLNGDLMPINGILPMIVESLDSQKTFVVPKGNENEAKLIPEAKILSFNNLIEIIQYFNVDAATAKEFKRKETLKNKENSDNNKKMETISKESQYIFLSNGEKTLKKDNENEENLNISKLDFSDINGQKILKRACEIAASGMHNMLIVGPPGTGKTMISERMSTIMPPLNNEEKLEVSKVYSVCGLLKNKKKLLEERPFRNPHHTITKAALAGGGISPIPGEISLAHQGVLFLDEFTEFQKSTIEILRQPLEDKKINLTRMNYNVTYPADFLLLASMNPCNCGYYPNMQKCRCTPSTLKRYLNKLSQPLLDRIDITVFAPEVKFNELIKKQKNETSAEIRKRVIRCQQIQYERYKNESFFHNSQIPAGKIGQYVPLNDEQLEYLNNVYEKYNLTARTFHKLLRVIRTIADLDNSEVIKTEYILEALCYKGLTKDYYEGGTM
ncbi:YifB family Mg chelatase-like AAA ATPase [Lachnobacterium bovis]|uniref:YifB family Mg chelatase-like AAA ATPase n=1 Tax=Lachnobacterium bovis TaxID=140626 RepID=UPI0003B74349|nr:YifB family Mg chelatase-like AAA ATPase [Lachnobacterium bovis]